MSILITCTIIMTTLVASLNRHIYINSGNIVISIVELRQLTMEMRFTLTLSVHDYSFRPFNLKGFYQILLLILLLVIHFL